MTIRLRPTWGACALCAACSIYDSSLLPGSSSGAGGSGGDGGSGAAGSGGGFGAGNAGTLAGRSGAGGGATDASADRDGSSGQGGSMAVDAASEGDSRSGAGGTGGSGGTGDASGAGGAGGINTPDSGTGGASMTDGASGTSGAGGTDAGADGAAGKDGAGGADGGNGADAPTTCASHPLSGKGTWMMTASHSSLGNSQESDPLYNPPSHAIDGSISERWSTGKPQAGNEWLEIDFGVRVAIGQVTLQLGTSSTDHPRGYAIRVSEMPLDTTAPVLVSGAGQPSVDTAIVLVAPAIGRYLLISQTGAASSSWWSVAEVNVACAD